jgi:LemA protein
MRYNKAVQSYNQQIQQFPNLVLAKAFGFKNKFFFQTMTSSAAKNSMP